MPTFNAATKSAESIWKSPDGQREIFKVILDVDGNELEAKTYSKDISVAGWTGEIITEEKQGKFGIETFVKQPPKEFTPGGSGNQGGYKPKAGQAGGRTTDMFTMYLSYAKDLAIASVKDGKFDSELYAEILSAVEAGGNQLYEARPDAKPKDEPIQLNDPATKLTVEDIFGKKGEEESAWSK